MKKWIALVAVFALMLLNACGAQPREATQTADDAAEEAIEDAVQKEVIEEAPQFAIFDEFRTIGNIVTFGSYEQDNNLINGSEPIEWIVLNVQNDRALLLSLCGLDAKPFSTVFERDITTYPWETCSLRAWLNESFLNIAFSAEEQALIPTITVSADKNPNYDIDPGNDTQDQIFLLSLTEAEKYFPSGGAPKCSPTAYAIAQGCYVEPPEEEWSCNWWLRTPGDIFASVFVDYTCSINVKGIGVNFTTIAIRPALWVDLDTIP